VSRADRTEETLARLGQAAAALRSTDAWQAMLRTRARFHSYSVRNQILIWCQMPEATQVAGYRAWQGLGRQVVKGSKAIWILAPMVGKDDDGERKVFGFRAVTVFDVSQTEGDPLPEVTWPEADTAPAGLFDQLLAGAHGAGYTIELDVDPHVGMPGARGWCKPDQRRISLRSAPEPGLCATLLHELAHCCDPEISEDPDRATKELVAESAAYVVGSGLGVGMGAEVEHYLAAWEADEKVLLELLARIRATEMAMGAVVGDVRGELGAAA
jgi:hypothetical protein